MSKAQSKSAECWLCLNQQWDADTKELTFHSYALYSTAPWDTTNLNLVMSALYMVRADTFSEAHKNMIYFLRHLGEEMKLPFWVEVWEHLDPSPEAHMKRFERDKKKNV